MWFIISMEERLLGSKGNTDVELNIIGCYKAGTVNVADWTPTGGIFEQWSGCRNTKMTLTLQNVIIQIL